MGERRGETVYFEDAGGTRIKFFSFDGIPLPTFPGDQSARIKAIPSFQARPDDVFICGYPKSGSSWLVEILHMLLSGVAEHFTGNKMTSMLEVQDQPVLEKQRSPRLLNFHFGFDRIPADIIEKGAKIVYILRNPKDVCVSHYHHHHGLVGVYDYHGAWPDYFPLWLSGKVDYGSWFPYVRGWEEGVKRHPEYPIYTLRYEVLKQDFAAETRRLAEFLGVARDDRFFSELERQCNFAVMKEAKESGFAGPEHAEWRTKKATFLRKGIVGDWKNHFTVAQNELFDATYAERMTGSSLTFTYEL